MMKTRSKAKVISQSEANQGQTVQNQAQTTQISSENQARIHQTFIRTLALAKEALDRYNVFSANVDPESNDEFQQLVQAEASQALAEVCSHQESARNMIRVYGKEACILPQSVDLSERNTPPLVPASEAESSRIYPSSTFPFFAAVPQSLAQQQAEAELIESLGEYISQL
ncbi:MAG: hypothetical protein EPN84_06030 [Legionella sp.]|nr:MAG: hypothetical protein EPN84_06030 [Legionella sp.]